MVNKMTEDELKVLEAEILGAALPDLETERDWLTIQLIGEGASLGMLKQEQHLMAAFRLAKYMRQDERFESIRADLKKVRSIIEYIRTRTKEIEAELKVGK